MFGYAKIMHIPVHKMCYFHACFTTFFDIKIILYNVIHFDYTIAQAALHTYVHCRHTEPSKAKAMILSSR